MTTMRFFSLLALSTLLGLTACSQANSPEPGGGSGGAPGTGGATNLGGSVVKAAAASKGVPYIDLMALSTAWYNTLGSKTVAMTYHANGTDQTHTNLPGAEKIAELVVKAIKDQNIGLAPYLR